MSRLLHAQSVLCLFVVSLGIPLAAQSGPTGSTVTQEVREYRIAHEAEILNELRDLLALPNVASDRENIERNANHIVAMLEARGAIARLLRVEGSPPAVLGQLDADGATRTVVFYAHYDGQPVDTTRWSSSPWQPVLRDGILEEGASQLSWGAVQSGVDPEWRVYARSASDDKSPIVALLRSIDALRDRGLPLSVNLKFFFEGEEEAGSPHLRSFLERYRDQLDADLWIFCDGPVHQTRLPQVVYGVRGVMGMGITTYGATRVLHSGHYGNWSPNPAVMLVQLLASMRDDEGRILIDGFYDDVRPISDNQRTAIEATPDVETGLKDELSLGRTEGEGNRLLEQIMDPAMNFDGLAAGNVGAAARNAIPTRATAALDFRLVPDQTPERVRELVIDHLRSLGYHVVSEDPDAETLRSHERVVRVTGGAGYPATGTPMDLPVSLAVEQVVRDAFDQELVTVPLLGGSLPLNTFEEVLGVPLVIVPMVNHDNNQHGANENLRIQNLWDGLEMYAALMARLGHVWSITASDPVF
jgi:acetylornithine deacetylase/succinyl-diaminopimelate desuccinylase-like protein